MIYTEVRPKGLAPIVFQHLHSERFLRILSKITGMNDLIPDNQLYAAGLAQGGNGSFLNVHIDNSSHPVQPSYRRLNLLIYLNKETCSTFI